MPLPVTYVYQFKVEEEHAFTISMSQHRIMYSKADVAIGLADLKMTGSYHQFRHSIGK